jgi:hypothetical protein
MELDCGSLEIEICYQNLDITYCKRIWSIFVQNILYVIFKASCILLTFITFKFAFKIMGPGFFLFVFFQTGAHSTPMLKFKGYTQKYCFGLIMEALLQLYTSSREKPMIKNFLP